MHRKAEKNTNIIPKKSLSVVIDATFVIAIATIIQVVVSFFQWRSMRDQLRQQQESFAITERAWVSLNATQFMYTNDKNGVPRADSVIKITNTGPSPAFNIHFWGCGQVLESPPTVATEPNPGINCMEEDLGTLGTNIPITFQIPDTIHTIVKNSLPNSSSDPGYHFYTWGRITYETFEKNGKHVTSFCLRNGLNQLAPCAKGNSSD